MDTESFKIMNQDFVKHDRFDGNNFNRWKDKLKFLLTGLKIAYVLDPNLQSISEDPKPTEGQQPDIDTVKALKEQRRRRIEDDELTRGHILDTLSTFSHQGNYGRLWNSNTKLMNSNTKLMKKVQISI